MVTVPLVRIEPGSRQLWGSRSNCCAVVPTSMSHNVDIETAVTRGCLTLGMCVWMGLSIGEERLQALNKLWCMDSPMHLDIEEKFSDRLVSALTLSLCLSYQYISIGRPVKDFTWVLCSGIYVQPPSLSGELTEELTESHLFCVNCFTLYPGLYRVRHFYI